MALARALFLFLFATSVAFFLMYVVTGRVDHRRRGVVLLGVTVGTGLAFFLVLAVLRLCGWA